MEVKSTPEAQIEKEVDEESQAQIDVWKYVFAYAPVAVVKCAIELQIPEVLENHGGIMALPELSTALGCSPHALHRIMRYLTHRGIFKQTITSHDSSVRYSQTPLSRLLVKNGANSMSALFLMENSPALLTSWHSLRGSATTDGSSAFKVAHGRDIWKYAAVNPVHNKLFNDAMACHARIAMSAIIDQYPEVFKGINSLVNVGGGDGTTLHTLVKSYPWIHGINFDLHHVVSVAPQREGIEHVGGNIFETVPKADAAFIMWVLHNWSDDGCIGILRKCREAIPNDVGKVIIADVVIKEGKEDEYTGIRLDLDMVMMAHTEGKERTSKEWEYIVKAAGFTRYTEKHIQALISVIEAYP